MLCFSQLKKEVTNHMPDKVKKNEVFVPNETVCSPEFGADGCVLPEDPSEEAQELPS